MPCDAAVPPVKLFAPTVDGVPPSKPTYPAGGLTVPRWTCEIRSSALTRRDSAAIESAHESTGDTDP